MDKLATVWLATEVVKCSTYSTFREAFSHWSVCHGNFVCLPHNPVHYRRFWAGLRTGPVLFGFVNALCKLKEYLTQTILSCCCRNYFSKKSLWDKTSLSGKLGHHYWSTHGETHDKFPKKHCVGSEHSLKTSDFEFTAPAGKLMGIEKLALSSQYGPFHKMFGNQEEEWTRASLLCSIGDVQYDTSPLYLGKKQ